MLDQVEILVSAGAAVHLLQERSKRPVREQWSTAPVATMADLRREWRPGMNVGLRPGEFSRVDGRYIHLIDLDIRDSKCAAAASAALKALLPTDFNPISVISGSGGLSRHLYFLTDEPLRSKKLAFSPEKWADANGKMRSAWEIELYGTGKQVVLPPSIHPETGKPYRWEQPGALDMLDLGAWPVMPASVIKRWGATVDKTPADGDDLAAVLRAEPMGLSRKEVEEILRDIPRATWCDDRDGWLQVGMALHHEFQGRAEGLDLWNKFSAQSPKYDAADQGRVWESFRGKPAPLRMATLVKAAGEARAKREMDGGDDDESDFDDYFEDLDDDDDPIEAPAEGDQVAGPLQPEQAWVSNLDISAEGGIKPTLHNLVLICSNDERLIGVPALNEFSGEIVIYGRPGKRKLRKSGTKPVRQLIGPLWDAFDPINGTEWSESHDDAVRAVLTAPKRQGGYGINITDRDLSAAINMAAQKRRFHPVREYLKAQTWDGRERVERLWIDYCGLPDTPYARETARNTLVAAVARVYEPGHKFDFVCILEGVQGKRKTSFIATLGKHWSSELDGDIHRTQQMVESMQSSWIIEIPELSGFSRSDVRAIKAFVSRKADKVRLAYDRRASIYRRQCVFLGSTNDDVYLRDNTGGRRFWPICVQVSGDLDIARLEAEIDQIWAEAHALYLKMRAATKGPLPLFLRSPEAVRISLELQERRRVETAEDGFAGRIAAWLDEPVHGFADESGEVEVRDETCLIEIWVDCLGRDVASYNQNAAYLVGTAMRSIPGWSEAGPRRTARFGTQRVFRRADV